MEFLSTYIKTITFYVVFINIIEMVMPSDKYSSYIRLFLGLVLVYIIIKPVFLLNINYVSNDIFKNYENYILSNSQNIDLENMEETKIELVTNSYIENEKVELINLVEANTNYKVIQCELIINKNVSTYGEIEEVILVLSDLEDTLVTPIEEIKITKNNMSHNGESDKILEIKNIIKEVYNLSLNNININIVN